MGHVQWLRRAATPLLRLLLLLLLILLLLLLLLLVVVVVVVVVVDVTMCRLKVSYGTPVVAQTSGYTATTPTGWPRSTAH